MASLYTHQSQNVWKTWALMVGFFVMVILVGWFFSFYYNSPLILYIAVAFSVIMNVASYWWSDKIVLRVTGARPATREEFFDLYTVTENLAITAGLPMPRLYVIRDSAPNAFATGRDKEHAVIAATTGLIAMLERSELEGVIAHELSHIGNRDMLVSTVVVVLVGFITLLSDFFTRSLWFGGENRNRGGGQLGMILMVIGIILAILSPIIASLIHLAISRKREFLADASGAILTRYPAGLASALQKIAQYSRPMQKANHATAHLFIANPFGRKENGEVSFFTKIFSTHPPVEERVKALLGERR